MIKPGPPSTLQASVPVWISACPGFPSIRALNATMAEAMTAFLRMAAHSYLCGATAPGCHRHSACRAVPTGSMLETAKDYLSDISHIKEPLGTSYTIAQGVIERCEVSHFRRNIFSKGLCGFYLRLVGDY